MLAHCSATALPELLTVRNRPNDKDTGENGPHLLATPGERFPTTVGAEYQVARSVLPFVCFLLPMAYALIVNKIITLHAVLTARIVIIFACLFKNVQLVKCPDQVLRGYLDIM